MSNIPELFLYPVEERGKPNQERIVILVNETINLGQYGIMVGYAGVNQSATPFQDNLFWFGNGVVNKGDWIMLFTGKGEPKSDIWLDAGTKIYSVHWGRDKTMFTNTNVVPMLFRIDAINVGIAPVDVPQLSIGKHA
ncbi:MAG TPA: hypothetical protein ENH74_05940 [Methylophaga sp.]|nr:hypothetical protein [Methylophaga sp.]HEC59011.1 hypothetical protein [Methylophaga sp.]